jgi:hypothetical protein
MINIDEREDEWKYLDEDYKDLNIYTDKDDSDCAIQDK